MIYRPRARVILTLQVPPRTGDDAQKAHDAPTIDIEVRCRLVEIERNSHLQADTARIEAEYNDLNIDPRLLRHATAQIWMGNSGEDDWEPEKEHLRFIGVAVSASRKTVEGGLCVEMKFEDYTSMFLAQKPFSPDGVPSYSQTLKEAWARICKHVGYWDVSTEEVVSNVEALSDAIIGLGDGVDLFEPIGRSVPARLAAYGKLTPKAGDSAWDVWQRCCMSLGLISYIDRDQCVVTSSSELFKEKDAPVFLYGRNILECDEQVDTKSNQRGVLLYSYDHDSGKIIEAFYPPPGDPRINAKRKEAYTHHAHSTKAPKKTPNNLATDQYDPFEYHGIKDPQTLFDLARRAYDERSRQEVQGSIKTAEMFGESEDGATVYDLLELQPGSFIRVDLDREASDALADAEAGEDVRYQRLLDIGYTEDTARLLSHRSLVTHTSMAVKSVRVVLEDSGDSGRFEVDINYQNKIRLGEGIAGDED
jgi:hypothetical protein